jgi:hypothetical protein
MVTSVVKWMIAVLVFSFPPADTADFSMPHPFYVCVTEINHNAKDKILEISCKIFTNDFESTLEKAFQTEVDLTHPKDKDATDKMIGIYIEKHLQIKVDGKPQSLQYVGSEKKNEATWCYFQVNNIPSVKRIDISNNILYEMFASQINIMHVTVSGIRKSLEITNPTGNASFEF